MNKQRLDPKIDVNHLFITMPDGTRLAAKIWLPSCAKGLPVPAVLEYLPYRYQDGPTERDNQNHGYFALHGYASIRVDIRGTGNSDGILLGEYLKQEQDDALAILDWLQNQSWCSGEVGMMGISWGGFNGLQIAARQHPALKAVISICSTHDRYSGDCHYMGGCLLDENFSWGSNAFSLVNHPPDPEVVGDGWRDMWRQRLEADNIWMTDWLSHQIRDDFFKHGSVCEDYSAIKAAIYAVGGWSDGFSNSVFSLLEGLTGPRKGLVGPWGHKYAHLAKPGPSIDFLSECVRWWDYWLKGIDTGIMDEPMLTTWIQEPHKPQTFYSIRPGRWVRDESWPTPNTFPRTYWLRNRSLSTEAGDGVDRAISSPQTTGSQSGNWGPYGAEPDEAGDQRQEAGGSLIYESETLSQSFDVLGAPEVALEISSDKSFGAIAVCLSEVHPDGAAQRVSYRLLNLSHRESHEMPEPLVPGHRYAITIKLNEIGHTFGKGNQIRIAISNAYWPVAWPMPGLHRLTVHGTPATLKLPERNAPDTEEVRYDPPLCSDGNQNSVIAGAPKLPLSWDLTQDMTTGVVTSVIRDDGPIIEFLEYNGWCRQEAVEKIQVIDPSDPLSASLSMTRQNTFSRGDWKARTSTATDFSATKTDFVLKTTSQAWFDDELEHEEIREHKFPRVFN